MDARRVDPGIAGTRFSPFDFTWEWQTTQLLSRAAGAALDDARDQPLLLPDSGRPGHPMIPFNGALLARNRAEVMDRLIGGYENWQAVGRWGSAKLTFHGPIPAAGSGRVESSLTEVGGTSKGHATVGFSFHVADRTTGRRLADGWMLLFLLGCAPERVGKLEPPRLAIPDGPPDAVVRHATPVNTTLDWALPTGDWNATHFTAQKGNPAPLVHGPRNLALVLHDAARLYSAGHLERIVAIDLGSLPAPHFPGEATETHLWRSTSGETLCRLIVPGSSRLDGETVDKVVLDRLALQIE